MIHFCTKSDPPPVLILLPTMEEFGQKPSDKQKGRQTGKAKLQSWISHINFLSFNAHLFLYSNRCSLLVCQVSPRFAKIKQNLK